MEVYRELEQIPAVASAIGLGTFDGVHLGHRAVLGRVVERARSERLRSMALTFDPHPLEVLAPPAEPFLLTTLEERLERFSELGLDAVLALRFDEALRSTEPEVFVERVLVRAVGARIVLSGPDFTFGRDRRGTPDLLRALGARWGFEVEVVPRVQWQGAPVSSSRIRDLLRRGEVEVAAELLRRPYTVRGDVERVVEAAAWCLARVAVPPRKLLPAPAIYEVELLEPDAVRGLARPEGETVVLVVPRAVGGPLTVAFLRRADPSGVRTFEAVRSTSGASFAPSGPPW